MAGELVRAEQRGVDVRQDAPGTDLSAQLMESVLLSGDLKQLKPADRVRFYLSVCESLKLNPLTKPFDYVMLNGRLTLYAKKDATDQLRTIHGVSVQIVNRETVDDVYTVTARAINPAGREDEDVGSVSIGNLKGEAKANAIMKAHTKAKRRVTLSICGMGFLDESEVEAVRGARRVKVNHDTGEILDAAEEVIPDVPTSGSKEEQAEVAEKKLAELRGKEAAVKAAEKRSRGWFEQMVSGFNEMKERLGSDAYYRILGNAGYTHSNELPDRKAAVAVYKEMAAELKYRDSTAQHESSQEPALFAVTAEDYPG